MANKMKPNKSLKKRIKVTGRGKIRRYAAGSGHLKSRKSPKRLRNFRKSRGVSPAFADMIRGMMGLPTSDVED
jgi:large subunit ribosomal protein L35